MWINFSISFLNTKFSSNNLNVPIGASEVEYLDYIVEKEGVRVDPKKIEDMQDWTRPKNLNILCSFLGLTSYYRKFVKNYGKIVAPLIYLLKKNSFN
jgi:hypothetical protein